jgi:tripeptide aminopeptidase
MAESAVSRQALLYYGRSRQGCRRDGPLGMRRFSPLYNRSMTSLLAFTLSVPLIASTQSQLMPPRESVVDRFLRYVKIDTQSREGAGTVPSTESQREFAQMLAKELRALGVEQVRVSEHAIVYATLPGNLPPGTSVPVVGFIAHMDTSPAVSGANVHPIVHENYQGGDIVLPKDPTQVITVEDNPVLKELVGDDIITADGTTLLGSDDKAGVAAIMTLVDILLRNPQIPRGTIAVAFTPDEEVGTGIAHFDVEGFGAEFAYTVDGGGLGEISDETWSARTATVTFRGRSTHPGTAKGIMVNSAYALADFLAQFPDTSILPETTEGREGFIHPFGGVADVEESSVRVLLRDFEVSGLEKQETLLRAMIARTENRFPRVGIDMTVQQNYLNMKEVLKDHPELTEHAMEAARRAGLKPFIKPIRGGTDGSRLTFKGLPTPNLFTGGHNFHGRLEFNSRRGLEKTTETLVHLVQIFSEGRASGAARP